MSGIEAEARRLATDYKTSGFLRPEGSALTFARELLPHDDSALQWSPLGGGITHDPQTALDELLARFVMKYEHRHRQNRTDEEVWKPVRDEFHRRKIASYFEETTIRGSADSIHFSHAWKNGLWHCVQPISMDLLSPDTIKDKARRWVGHLTAMNDVCEVFKPYFVVGAPSGTGLRHAYRDALRILEQAPCDVEIFEEGQIDQLADQLEDQVRSHATDS